MGGVILSMHRLGLIQVARELVGRSAVTLLNSSKESYKRRFNFREHSAIDAKKAVIEGHHSRTQKLCLKGLCGYTYR